MADDAERIGLSEREREREVLVSRRDQQPADEPPETGPHEIRAVARAAAPGQCQRGGQPADPSCILVGLIQVPPALMIYFKDGPLAWNGLFSFYIPALDFFGWALAMTFLTARAVKTPRSPLPCWRLRREFSHDQHLGQRVPHLIQLISGQRDLRRGPA